MKKLLGIAALILAFTPFAQAQNNGSGLAGHPEARNDRQPEPQAHAVPHDMRHAMHHHHAKHRHMMHHAK